MNWHSLSLSYCLARFKGMSEIQCSAAATESREVDRLSP